LREAERYAKSKAMPTDPTAPANKRPKRPITPAAERALAEAEARRAERGRLLLEQPKEIAGRGSPDPTRYGDWEIYGRRRTFS